MVATNASLLLRNARQSPMFGVWMGGAILAFALLTLSVLLLVEPVQVTLRCDRETCTYSQGNATFPASQLSTVRFDGAEPRLVVGETRISNAATGADVAAEHERVRRAIVEFAAGDAPSLALTYPIGGGSGTHQVVYAAAAVALGLVMIVVGLVRRRRAS